MNLVGNQTIQKHRQRMLFGRLQPAGRPREVRDSGMCHSALLLPNQQSLSFLPRFVICLCPRYCLQYVATVLRRGLREGWKMARCHCVVAADRYVTRPVSILSSAQVCPSQGNAKAYWNLTAPLPWGISPSQAVNRADGTLSGSCVQHDMSRRCPKGTLW